MELRHRTLITGKNFDAFRDCFKEVTRNTGDVAQLCIKKAAQGSKRQYVRALVGVPGKPAGRVYELAIDGPLAKTDAGWADYGRKVAEQALDWLKGDKAYEAADIAARAAGYDVWAHSLSYDLLDDEISTWATTWRMHLGGVLHPKAKVDLIAQLASALDSIVEAEVANRIAAQKAKRLKKVDA